MKKLERTLDSREVAEMVGKNHADLMRDIRRYCEQLNESNIALVDFFKEVDYKDGKGQKRPCYNVTKKGCEFISHKLTGIKGTEFTARYINRFHDMEDTINKPLTQLEILSQSVDVLNRHENEIKQIDGRMDKLEFDIPLYGSEADELSGHVRRKGMKVLGGKQSEAYKDTEIRSKVYRDIYDQIKREFGIFNDSGHAMTYKALKRKYLADAHEFIDCYDVPTYLLELINNANAQARLDIA